MQSPFELAEVGGPDDGAGRLEQLGLGALRTEADAAVVGKVALGAGVALTELRAAEGAGLEEMFLELTSDTQRERAA